MSAKQFLGREAILSAQDLPKEEVFVPEWNSWLYVRALTGAERDKFEASITKQKGKNTEIDATNMRAKLVALTVVDEAGERIFKQSDVELLGQKSAAALNRVFDVAAKLSGLSKGDVEELEKN